MASKFISAASFLTAATFGGAAIAGGYVVPIEAPVPVVVTTPPVETFDWAGAYVGGSLGYVVGSDDIIGSEYYNATGELIQKRNNLGQVDVKGATLALHAGYRWQLIKWVYGPELGIEGGSVDAQDSLSFAGRPIGADIESTVNYIASLRFKAGYTLNPKTLVYGTLGFAHGDFDYEATDTVTGFSQTKGYTDTAWTAGLGVERKLNEKFSMFAEWEFRGFSKTPITYDAPELGFEAGEYATTQATPAHHNIKVGVNYRF